MCVPKSEGGMGFGDLKCFNQALLAKQVWRLHNVPNSLLGSTLKARYYKHSDVLDASRGYDPSFVWRSIWGAKSLLLEGLGWRVGNGWNIRALSQKWVTMNGAMQSPTTPNSTHSELLVGELVDHEAMRWKTDIIHHMFDPPSAEAILAIHLSNWDYDDRLYWWYNRDGKYSVRSGYWLARSIHPRHLNSSNMGNEDKLW